MPVAAPVAGAHIANAEANYEEDHSQLDHNNRRIETCALANANHQNRSDYQCN